MRQGIKHISKQVCILVAAIAVTSCSNTKEYHFTNPGEAITACESELKQIVGTQDADIKDITRIANDWIALQDSTIKIIATTDSMGSNQPLINRFFTLADSIRAQISLIAYAKERSIDEVIYLKLNTVYGLPGIKSSKDYKEALDFYEDLDDEKIYPDAQTAVKQYRALFSTIGTVKKENDLLRFMTEEDRCYRSILKYQTQIDIEEINEIADETESFFGNLQGAVSQQDTEQNNRLLTYLNVRINRRIIQNAETCVSDIQHKVKLDETARESYRWAILQPYLSIDKYMAAYLTKKQKKSLEEIGSRLPEYLIYLDDMQVKVGKKENEKMSRILANSLLSMYLKQTL